MDDLKLFLKSEEQTDTLVHIFSPDIRMEIVMKNVEFLP